MIAFGKVAPGSMLYIPFETFASSTGAPITITGLATSDIKVYKDGGTTERASASGFALLDTDGIDFDGITGIHGFSIDLADNTTADFWASGSRYFVVVSTVTVDSQTMSFIAASFRIGFEGASLDTTIATLASQTSFTLTNGPAEDDALNGRMCVIHDAASAVQQGSAIVLDYTGSTKTVTLAAATTFTVAAKDNIAFMGMAPLQPTTAGRTLDVSAGGEAGLDWANIGSPTTSVTLSGTTVATVTNQLTGAAIATAVWQDSTSGDFTTASSIGKALFTGGNVAPGGVGGHLISGSNSGGTTLAGLTVTGAVSLAGVTTATHASNDIRGVLLQATQTGVTIPTVTTLTNLPAITTDWLTATGLAASAVTEIQSGLATSSAQTSLQSDVTAIKAKTDSLTFTVASTVDCNLTNVNGDSNGVAAFNTAIRSIVEGTCDTGGSTTSIVTSALAPAASVTDQLKGRIVIFKENTTTTALRGQATDITGSSSGGVLTVTALTTAPATGDVFIIQ